MRTVPGMPDFKGFPGFRRKEVVGIRVSKLRANNQLKKQEILSA